MSDENTQDQELPIQDELATLKIRADRLGVHYHPNIGVEKLREKISAKINDTSDGDAPAAVSSAPVAAQPEAETLAQRRKRLRNEALKLVRIRVTCMNPAKKDWDGEIITTGNALVGTVRKFIPFNGADDGWHVPHILYEQLRDKQCQVFVTEKTKHGVAIRRGKLIKEFAIEVLPPLTATELHDLAQRQAMAKAID